MDKIRILIRRFGALYFSEIFKYYWKIKLRFTTYNQPPIIILTPGKVGSSSIYYAFKKFFPNHVYHIHRLSRNGINKSMLYHKNSDRRSIPLHLITADLLERRLIKYKGRISIISIQREPIAREISSFMQNIEFYKNSIENKDMSINIEKAQSILTNNLADSTSRRSTDWIDDEIGKNLGIDIYKDPFNQKKQFKIYENNRYSLLIMKMETMESVFSQAISEFLKICFDIELKNKNIGAKKYYASDYKEIINSIEINKSVIDDIYNYKFVKYFYSDKELLYFKKKWLKN